MRKDKEKEDKKEAKEESGKKKELQKEVTLSKEEFEAWDFLLFSRAESDGLNS